MSICVIDSIYGKGQYEEEYEGRTEKILSGHREDGLKDGGQQEATRNYDDPPVPLLHHHEGSPGKLYHGQ